MSGTDLKLTNESAVAVLTRECEAAIERVRRVGADMAAQLSAANMAVKPIDIAKADIAAVIDYTQHHTVGPGSQLYLSFNGNQGGGVVINNGMAAGSYRALVLIERIEDKETAK